MLNDAATGSDIAASPVRRTHARFFILALVTVGTMINYLDRTVLSVAAPFLSKDLGLDPAVMGLVFSAFSWTYAAAQIPGGVFLDRFGARLTYFLSLTVWSCFTLLQGFAFNLSSLLAFRFGLGGVRTRRSRLGDLCPPCRPRDRHGLPRRCGRLRPGPVDVAGRAWPCGERSDG